MLDSLAMALLERETIDDEEVALLIAGSPLPAPAPRSEEPEDAAPSPSPPSPSASSPGPLGEAPPA